MFSLISERKLGDRRRLFGRREGHKPLVLMGYTVKLRGLPKACYYYLPLETALVCYNVQDAQALQSAKWLIRSQALPPKATGAAHRLDVGGSLALKI
jgi:hypothetical protein